MNIQTKKIDDAVILYPKGEITFDNADELSSAIQNHLEKNIDKIIINLKDISYIDSSGIGMLISLWVNSDTSGNSFRICEVNQTLDDIFKLVNIDSFITIDTTEAESMQAH